MDNPKLKVHLFCCSASLEAADLLDAEDALPETELKVISLPCSGKVDIPYLVKAFEAGAHGVMLVTCKKEDCRYIQGSSRAQKRVQAVDDLMEETGLGRGRIGLVAMDDRGAEGVIENLKELRKTIGALPTPNMAHATY